MYQIQKKFDWGNNKKENIYSFIPLIYYGKVIKIHSGDCFTIITPILFLNDKI